MNFFRKLFGGGGDEAPPEKHAETPQPPPINMEKPEPASDYPLDKMETVPAPQVVEPFSKINYWLQPDGSKRVRVYFLMERPIEGAQTGVAIDGSASMKGPFGKLLEGQPTTKQLEDYRRRGLVQTISQDGENYHRWSRQAVDELIERAVFRYTENIVEPQARAMTAYLSKFDADGGTTVVYWATGNGRGIEEVGDLTGPQCATFTFDGPKVYGDNTHLLPALQYFVERFDEASWGMYVFITDGRLDDLLAVKRYCIDLAQQIDRGERNDIKLVLIGVGDEIDESQMEELDDLETGTDIDLWDHKIAAEMKQLAEIFAEVVSETVIVVPNDGVIRDAAGNVIQDYRDSGLPALMLFDLPPDSDHFTLEVAGQSVTQPLG